MTQRSNKVTTERQKRTLTADDFRSQLVDDEYNTERKEEIIKALSNDPGDSRFKFKLSCPSKKIGHDDWASVRNTGSGFRRTPCPYCIGTKLDEEGSNSLAKRLPEIAKLWNEPKNGKSAEKTPFSYIPDVWWVCDHKHEWQTSIRKMSRRVIDEDLDTFCPICEPYRQDFPSLKISHPELAELWDRVGNADLDPSFVRSNSSDRVWWRCEKNDSHRYRMSVRRRVDSHKKRGAPCPMCVNKGHWQPASDFPNLNSIRGARRQAIAVDLCRKILKLPRIEIESPERLPTELALSSSYGVSKVTIHSSLRILSDANVVIRHTSGTDIQPDKRVLVAGIQSVFRRYRKLLTDGIREGSIQADPGSIRTLTQELSGFCKDHQISADRDLQESGRLADKEFTLDIKPGFIFGLDQIIQIAEESHSNGIESIQIVWSDNSIHFTASCDSSHNLDGKRSFKTLTVEELDNEVQRTSVNRHENSQENEVNTAVPPQVGVGDELMKYVKLLQDGHLTEEEFAGLKQTLLQSSNKPPQSTSSPTAQEHAGSGTAESSQDTVPDAHGSVRAILLD